MTKLTEVISTSKEQPNVLQHKLSANPVSAFKAFMMNILNGVSVGAVVSLVPAALLGNVMLALLPIFPMAKTIIDISNLSMILLAPVSALVSSRLFKLTAIQSATLALVALVGAKNWQIDNGIFMIKGTGDILNIIITLCLGVCFIQLVGSRLKAYNILLLPTLTLVIVGSISMILYPIVAQITTALGELISQVTLVQPVLMGILMAVIFGIMIISPISTVAVALTISLEGIASGTANLGITACGFTLALLGLKANGVGGSLVHFLGSPKVQMANVVGHPKIVIPVILNAAILGGLGAIFEIQGTPLSAGFGFSGLVGPLAAYNAGDQSMQSVLVIILLFFILPTALAIIARLLFINKQQLISDDDLKLRID